MKASTGIIGGSGLYDLEGLEILDELEIETPFGPPSDRLILARKNGHTFAFLPRHGRGHRIPPHSINYRANIYAMKLAGVRQIISISAVGSLREEIAPGDFVLVDQFVDRTNARPSTFFNQDIVAHVSMANPVCRRLTTLIGEACKREGIRFHSKGTYLAMQGPQFSTRAESHLYRRWGIDVIGMTNMPEAKLAREAEICYATVAMCTDYDCWKEDEADVEVVSVIETMQANVVKAKRMLDAFFSLAPAAVDKCPQGCHCALDHALITDLSHADAESLRQIHALIARKL